MSRKKDYTIETVLSSSKEYGSASINGRIVSKQAPFGLRPYMARFRKGCVPYMAGAKTALDYNLRNCDPTPTPPGNQTMEAGFIYSGPTMYAPTLTKQVYTYTQIIEISNSAGATPQHVGSIYLEARTYDTIGVLVNELKYGGGGKKAYIELKRFSNGVSLAQISAEGAGSYQNATVSSVTVGSAGWYDIYLSGTDAGLTVTNATSSIRGFYYDY